MKVSKSLLKSTFRTFLLTILFYVFAFFIYSEYERKMSNNYWKKIRAVYLALDAYYEKCKLFPTTSEGLALLSAKNNCWPGTKAVQENVSSINKDSTLLYFSEGKSFQLILFENRYGKYVTSLAP